MSRLPAPTVVALLGIRLDQGPLEQLLQQLVNIARDALPGADEVSTTLLRGDRGWTAAYTGQLALDADEMQYERGYGPCMDAGRTGSVLLIDDARKESRWPDYTAHVVERGVLSSLSVPLPMQTDVIGALNCYFPDKGFVDAPAAAASMSNRRSSVAARASAEALGDLLDFDRDRAGSPTAQSTWSSWTTEWTSPRRGEATVRSTIRDFGASSCGQGSSSTTPLTTR